MLRHTLYAYAEGNNLHDVADRLDTAFKQFVSEGDWMCGWPWAVNQRRDDDPSLGPDDLPDWEIGLNLLLPDPDAEPGGWFADVERIAVFLGQLHVETGRNFVIGIGDGESGASEDLYSVNSPHLDLVLLCKMIGIGNNNPAAPGTTLGGDAMEIEKG